MEYCFFSEVFPIFQTVGRGSSFLVIIFVASGTTCVARPFLGTVINRGNLFVCLFAFFSPFFSFWSRVINPSKAVFGSLLGVSS